MKAFRVIFDIGRESEMIEAFLVKDEHKDNRQHTLFSRALFSCRASIFLLLLENPIRFLFHLSSSKGKKYYTALLRKSFSLDEKTGL